MYRYNNFRIIMIVGKDKINTSTLIRAVEAG